MNGLQGSLENASNAVSTLANAGKDAEVDHVTTEESNRLCLDAI